MTAPLTRTIPPSILVVDDEPSILSALECYIAKLGCHVLVASDGFQALELFKVHRPPVVLTDLKMPGMGGDQLLQELRALDENVQVIIMTGFATIQSAVTTLKAGAFDYITKPFRLELVARAIEKATEHLELIYYNRQLQENSLHVLEAMVKTLEQRDYYTAGHSRRVTAFTDAMALALGLDSHQRHVIHLGSLIHDVGKIGIDDAILRKPGRLTQEEYEVIKSHPARGVNIVEPLNFLKETIPIIRHHHERFDGSGYPDGLTGDDIPLAARILTVADTYDAMTSSRAYRTALSRETTFQELRRCAGTQFDPMLVELFRQLPEDAGHVSPQGTPQ
jgi:putative two-component system response regulator